MSKGTFRESVYVADVEVSSTLATLMAAERLRAAGADVIDLGAGEPDFPTPENIKEAAKRAIDENFTRYTATSGIAPLKRAILDMMRRDFNVEYEPAQVIVTIGGKQGIFNGLASVVNPDDEVLIPAPYWVTFPETVRFLRARPVIVDCSANGCLLTADMVREHITPRTRLLIINSPNNPTGRIIPPAEFRRIVETAAEHGLYVLSDECYLNFAYAPAEPFTAGQLPAELRERVLISGSFSKSYAMTGWRIGYALGPEPWIQAMLKVQSHSTSNATSISQRAALEALTGPQEARHAMLGEYRCRRDFIVEALNRIEGITCDLPEGAFYVFPDVRGLLGGKVKSSTELANLLLEQAHVVVTDGAAFGASGFLRISYATSMEALRRGAERIAEVAAGLP